MKKIELIKIINKTIKTPLNVRSLVIMIVFFLAFFLVSNSIYGTTVDRSRSKIIMNTLTNIASGLLGEYKKLDSQKKVNIIDDRDTIANLNGRYKKKKKLTLINFRFSNLAETKQMAIRGREGIQAAESKIAKVIGKAFVYPNPFRQNSEYGGILRYELSKSMDVVIHIYDIMGHLLVKTTRQRGNMGGRNGINTIKIDKHLFENNPLSAGIYYFLIMNNGNILSKGKMAVKP
jgi:hypothetical protein